MTKCVDAIVRGPQPYFGTNGKLYAPGELVRDIPADLVSEDDTREVEIEVEARNGDMVKRKVKVPVKFRPVGSVPTIAGPSDPADVAVGNPDRLNVTDFLKKSSDEIEAAIASGTVDDHLPAIEQAEISSKGRKGVKEAITARTAAIGR